VWLNFRTSLERIAPESLTLTLYSFVHGDIWRRLTAQAQDRVASFRFECVLAPSKVNAIVDSPQAKESRRKLSLRLGTIGGGPRRQRHGDEFGCLKHRLADRRRPLRTIRHEHAGPGNGRKPHFHVSLLGQISNGRTRGDVSCDRCEIRRADNHGTGITLSGLD